jgi:hypothetical protein
VSQAKTVDQVVVSVPEEQRNAGFRLRFFFGLKS